MTTTAVPTVLQHLESYTWYMVPGYTRSQEKILRSVAICHKLCTVTYRQGCSAGDVGLSVAWHRYETENMHYCYRNTHECTNIPAVPTTGCCCTAAASILLEHSTGTITRQSQQYERRRMVDDYITMQLRVALVKRYGCCVCDYLCVVFVQAV